MNNSALVRAGSKALKATQGGNRSGFGEDLHWSFWDVQPLAITTLTHKFFAQSQGQGTPVKTFDQTNMIQGGSMPNGNHFTVKEIKMMYTGLGSKTSLFMQFFYQMLQQTTFDIRFVGKDSMGQWALNELFGNAFGVNIIPTVAGDNLPAVNQSIIKASFFLNIPIKIPALQNFEVNIVHHTAIGSGEMEGDLLKISLCGELNRLS